MSLYIFLGPSLSVPDARAVLDAHYLPPVAMGDVARLMMRRPTAIGIIDGVFERVPAVWHKEILFALAQGVPVYGASSMGALRAAELHAFGMTGVGRIFEDYRSGVLEDDDEVAVAHSSAEQGFRALSEPMVNIREGLRVALDGGILSRKSADTLRDYAKARFYPDRAWSDVLAAAAHLGVPEAEVRALKSAVPAAPNVKRDDALTLLETMRADFRHGARHHVATFTFEPTFYWNCLVAFEAGAHAPRPDEAHQATVSAVGRHVRLNRPDRDVLLRDALFSFLLYSEAKRCGLLPRKDLPADAIGALNGPGRTLFVHPEGCPSILDSIGRELVDMLKSRLDYFLAVELARRGELEPVIRDVQRRMQRLERRGVERTKLADLGIDLEALSQWYEAAYGKVVGTGDEHAEALNFGSWPEFLSEVIAEYAFRQEPKRVGDATT